MNTRAVAVLDALADFAIDWAEMLPDTRSELSQASSRFAGAASCNLNGPHTNPEARGAI
jgi:hypothetical protein